MTVDSLDDVSPRPALKRRRWRVHVACGLAALAVAGGVHFGLRALAASRQPETPPFLLNQSEALNRKLPAPVDTRTRLERVSGGPGLNFTYHYTVIAEAGDPAPLRLDLERARLRLRAAYCFDMRDFVALGVTAHWAYRDEAGAPLGVVDLAPEVCAPAPEPS